MCLQCTVWKIQIQHSYILPIPQYHKKCKTGYLVCDKKTSKIGGLSCLKNTRKGNPWGDEEDVWRWESLSLSSLGYGYRNPITLLNSKLFLSLLSLDAYRILYHDNFIIIIMSVRSNDYDGISRGSCSALLHST